MRSPQSAATPNSTECQPGAEQRTGRQRPNSPNSALRRLGDDPRPRFGAERSASSRASGTMKKPPNTPASGAPVPEDAGDASTALYGQRRPGRHQTARPARCPARTVSPIEPKGTSDLHMAAGELRTAASPSPMPIVKVAVRSVTVPSIPLPASTFFGVGWKPSQNSAPYSHRTTRSP